jgi:hypothetical protein
MYVAKNPVKQNKTREKTPDTPLHYEQVPKYL